jgi:hypothetical protein
MVAHLCAMTTIGRRCRRAAITRKRSWNVGGWARRRTYAVVLLSSLPAEAHRVVRAVDGHLIRL